MESEGASAGDSEITSGRVIRRTGPERGDRDFLDIWGVASTFQGWLTTEQAKSLWDAVTRLSTGAKVVEIGSHQGRSTVVLAAAIENRQGVVTAIDPFDDPRWGGGKETRNILLKNLAHLSLEGSCHIVQGLSTSERLNWSDRIDLLYIDGAHDFATVCDDLKWSDFLTPGGWLAIHDGFSSVGVTAALLRRVLPGDSLRYVERIGSLVWFVNERPTISTRVRLAGQSPWFLRNLLVKVSLRHDWRQLLRALRHESTEYPY